MAETQMPCVPCIQAITKCKNSGIVHLDLLDAARQVVAENLQIHAKLRGYEQDMYV